MKIKTFKQHSLTGALVVLLALPTLNAQAEHGGHRDRPADSTERIERKMARHAERLEDNLDRIEAKLDIRPDQLAAWDNWADTVRAQAANKMELARERMSTMQTPPDELDPVSRIDFKLDRMAQQIESLEALRGPTEELYNVLDVDQQASADRWLKVNKKGFKEKKHGKF